MSKGPGRWQRAIIEALNERGEFILVDLLPEGYTRAQYVALIRAANVLQRRRLVWIANEEWRKKQRGRRGRDRIVSVDLGTNGNQSQHLKQGEA